MIIVAESGATKTNWLTGEKDLYKTIGLNPLFHSSEFIYNELMKNPQLLKIRDRFAKVFFYGANCSSEARNKVVYDALKKYFPNATTITVDHDLKAAAVATFNGRNGIACILGTGSNSCIYDGKKMFVKVPALGYVLGDEGSGSYFGKKLLALYLYGYIPEATAKIMKEQYGLDKEKVLANVYQKPNANVYLAGLAKIMSETSDKDFVDELTETGFSDFFKFHVCCYENYKELPVHFVGSIAFYFKHILQKVTAQYGCELGIVEQEPVYRLLEWHLRGE